MRLVTYGCLAHLHLLAANCHLSGVKRERKGEREREGER
jgi:hypothetical protein